MSDLLVEHTAEDIAYLLSTTAIRERAAKIFQSASVGGTHFDFNEEALEPTADLVAKVTLNAYPTLELPFHSRWGHFEAAGRSRLAELDRALVGLDTAERARAKLDLVIVSVLLDAGSGPGWVYRDGQDLIGRSEGLAVASFRMFMEGAFSSSKTNPYRADAEGLAALSRDELAKGFQVGDDNPLVGVEGRLALLHSLGEAMANDSERFGAELPRPGGLYDFLSRNGRAEVAATELLDAVLRGLGPIWPGRISLGGVNLGDVWNHPVLGEPGTLKGLMPFHKLSQWLTYSLIEPIEEAGLKVSHVEGMTGLAEYRNGGLFVDTELLRLRDEGVLENAHKPGSELIVEWRALTVHTLDLIAPLVRERLEVSEKEFPLAKVLEGGTWRAGRWIAAEKRPGGGPPIRIDSDGTVF